MFRIIVALPEWCAVRIRGRKVFSELKNGISLKCMGMCHTKSVTSLD